jgi:hypothetical protein
MFNKIFAAALCAGALQFGAAHASTVDFGTGFAGLGADGDLVETFDLGGGVTGRIEVINGFGGQAQTGEGRLFDTTQPSSIDPDLVGPFQNSADMNAAPIDFDTALVIQERPGIATGTPDDEVRGGTILFIFDRLVDVDSVTFLDGEEGGEVLVGGNMVGTFGSGSNRDNTFTQVSLNGALGITELEVQLNGSGAIGALDVSRPAPVPVPASLPLLLLGVGALGVARRRRKAA